MIRRRFLPSFLIFSFLPLSFALGYIPENWEAEYEWHPEESTSGPVLIVVDLDDQAALVYRNGVEIGKTPVSTGKPGHRTPTGIFQILNKDADHHSSTYNNASMPFSERLTWSGIALHAGGLPGYPSSHGCVHLPYSFAKKLFEVTHKGTTVVITQKGHAPHQGVEPAAALLGLEEQAIEDGKLDELDHSVTWKPELSPQGSVTMFVSGKHEKVEVFRGGVLIGSAPLELNDPSFKLPTAVMLMLEDKVEKSEKKSVSSAVLVNPEPAGTHWATLSTSGKEDASKLAAAIKANLIMPLGFAQRLHQLAAPGMLVVTTPEEMTVETRTDEAFHVVNAGKTRCSGFKQGIGPRDSARVFSAALRGEQTEVRSPIRFAVEMLEIDRGRTDAPLEKEPSSSHHSEQSSLTHAGSPCGLAVLDFIGHDLALLTAGLAIKKLDGGRTMAGTGFHNDLILLIDEPCLLDVRHCRDDEGHRLAAFHDRNAASGSLGCQWLAVGTRGGSRSRGGIRIFFNDDTLSEKEWNGEKDEVS